MCHAFLVPEARKRPAEERRRQRFSGPFRVTCPAGFRPSPARHQVRRGNGGNRASERPVDMLLRAIYHGAPSLNRVLQVRLQIR